MDDHLSFNLANYVGDGGEAKRIESTRISYAN